MRQPSRDSGVTLIEVLVTVALACVMMALALGGWSAWAHARAQTETADQMRTVFRTAQERAVTEGTSMCVSFTATTYTVWRSSCTSGDVVDGPVRAEGDARLTGPSGGVVFAPRGTATGGDVTITRPGSSTSYIVRVEGFTGRPYICHDGHCNE